MKTFIAALMFVSTSAIAAELPECPMEIQDQKNCAPRVYEQHNSKAQFGSVQGVPHTPSINHVAHNPPPSPPPSHPTQSCQKTHR